MLTHDSCIHSSLSCYAVTLVALPKNCWQQKHTRLTRRRHRIAIDALRSEVDSLMRKLTRIKLQLERKEGQEEERSEGPSEEEERNSIKSQDQVVFERMDELFFTKMHHFVTDSLLRVTRIEKAIKQDLESTRCQLAAFLCEDVADFKLEECFRIFHSFVQTFRNAMEENKRRREAEERMHSKRLASNQNNATIMNSVTSSPSPVSRKSGSTSRPQSLELGGDLDASLFEFLRASNEGSDVFGCTLRRSGRRSSRWKPESREAANTSATDLDSRDRERNGCTVEAATASLNRRRGKNLSTGIRMDDSIEGPVLTSASSAASVIHQSQAFNNETPAFCRSSPHRRSFHSRRRISAPLHQTPLLDSHLSQGKEEEMKSWSCLSAEPRASMEIATVTGSQEEDEEVRTGVSPSPQSSASSSGFSSTSSSSVTPDRQPLKEEDILTPREITASDQKSGGERELCDSSFNRDSSIRRSRLPVRTNDLTSLPLTRMSQRASSAPATGRKPVRNPVPSSDRRNICDSTCDQPLSRGYARSLVRAEAAPTSSSPKNAECGSNSRSKLRSSGESTKQGLRYQTPLPKTSLVMRTTAKNAFSPVANFRRSSLVSSNRRQRTNIRSGNYMEAVVVPSKAPSHSSHPLSGSQSYARSSPRKTSLVGEFRSFMKQTSSSAAKALRNH